MTNEMILEGIACPNGYDPVQFQKAKETLLGIWSGRLSATLSGIEYDEPSASYIIKYFRDNHPTEAQRCYEKIYGEKW